MKTRTKKIFMAMKIISWIIFIGLCIKTGSIIISYFVSLFVNQVGANDLYLGLNLSDLYVFSAVHYSLMVFLIVLLWGSKALIFYFIIKIFLKINLVHPFSRDVAVLIFRISYVAFAFSVLTAVANEYCQWLIEKGVALHFLHDYLEGGPEFLFMSGIIFFIAEVFLRGIEIQSENELTI